MLMGVGIAESALRAIVCSNFSAKALLIKTDNQKLVSRFQVAYYVFMSLSLLSLAYVSMVSNKYSI